MNKNIYLIETDKPSRLAIHLGVLKYNSLTKNATDFKLIRNRMLPQNIYITSDEEIKEGDWTLMFDDLGNLFLCDKPQQYLGIEKGHHLNKGLKKIILTTDQDLIKDGVQAIEDEFLEWFVKNPSCEKIEVEKAPYDGTKSISKYWGGEYKITIPSEETLEQFMASLPYYGHCNHEYLEGIEEGAKWQQERMYSEEIIDILDNVRHWETCPNSYKVIIERFIEQFKKK